MTYSFETLYDTFPRDRVTVDNVCPGTDLINPSFILMPDSISNVSKFSYKNQFGTCNTCNTCDKNMFIQTVYETTNIFLMQKLKHNIPKIHVLNYM